MKLVFLCKRRPMGRDLFTRPYGRFFYIPHLLSQYGHEVYLLLLNYQHEPTVEIKKNGINWSSVSLLPKGPLTYIRQIKQLVEKINPDWIIGFSDTYFGILAQKLGSKYNIPSLIDAYDNYESYIPWLKPLHHLWRDSVSKATLVTAAGPNLAALLGQQRLNKPTVVVPMAADPIFSPIDKQDARNSLGLPLDKLLIGYCGSISAIRGIDILFDVYAELKQEFSNLGLVLSGRKENKIKLPRNIHWLGYLSDEKVVSVLNSVNVLTVINRVSKFGSYSYPVKLYEAMSCQVPVVATETPATRWILGDYPDLLVKADDPEALYQAIKNTLTSSCISYTPQTWEQSAAIFNDLLVNYNELDKST